jgi:hypothetical protein
MPAWRTALQGRLAALGDHLELVGSIAEAQERASFEPRALVLARNAGGAAAAAAAACGFDLAQGPGAVRLVFIASHAVSHFFHEVDRSVAEFQLRPEQAAPPLRGLPEEFPHQTYVPLGRVGSVACAELLLVRHRITGSKELLVQVEEGACAAEVADTLYRNFRARIAVAANVLRHELTRHHSFIAPGSIPFDFARQVDEATADLSFRARAA